MLGFFVENFEHILKGYLFFYLKIIGDHLHWMTVLHLRVLADPDVETKTGQWMGVSLKSGGKDQPIIVSLNPF